VCVYVGRVDPRGLGGDLRGGSEDDFCCCDALGCSVCVNGEAVESVEFWAFVHFVSLCKRGYVCLWKG
jgi:hypothetical protein